MPPINGHVLPDQDWNKLQDIADRFAAARLQGPVEDWRSYIPEADDSLRRPVLLELVKIDLEIAWRSRIASRALRSAARLVTIFL